MMRPEEPDWTLISKPSQDAVTVVRRFGLAAIAAGVAVLAFDAARRGVHLDVTALGLGLIVSGGYLWR